MPHYAPWEGECPCDGKAELGCKACGVSSPPGKPKYEILLSRSCSRRDAVRMIEGHLKTMQGCVKVTMELLEPDMGWES